MCHRPRVNCAVDLAEQSRPFRGLLAATGCARPAKKSSSAAGGPSKLTVSGFRDLAVRLFWNCVGKMLTSLTCPSQTIAPILPSAWTLRPNRPYAAADIISSIRSRFDLPLPLGPMVTFRSPGRQETFLRERKPWMSSCTVSMGGLYQQNHLVSLPTAKRWQSGVVMAIFREKNSGRWQGLGRLSPGKILYDKMSLWGQTLETILLRSRPPTCHALAPCRRPTYALLVFFSTSSPTLLRALSLPPTRSTRRPCRTTPRKQK